MDMELQIYACGIQAAQANLQLAFVEAGGLGVISPHGGIWTLRKFKASLGCSRQHLGAGGTDAKIVEVGTRRTDRRGHEQTLDNVEVQMRGMHCDYQLGVSCPPLKKSIMEAVAVHRGRFPWYFLTHSKKRLCEAETGSSHVRKVWLELANIGASVMPLFLQPHRDISGIQEAGAWALSWGGWKC
jgi:hypothetical protein